MARCKHNVRYGDYCDVCSTSLNLETTKTMPSNLDLSMKIASELVQREFPNERDAFKYHMYVFRQGAQQAALEILNNPEKYLK